MSPVSILFSLLKGSELVQIAKILTFLVVLEKVKIQLNNRGAKTIRSLGRVFRALDSYDKNRKVDTAEFFVGLNEIGCKLSREECKVKINKKSS